MSQAAGRVGRLWWGASGEEEKGGVSPNLGNFSFTDGGLSIFSNSSPLINPYTFDAAWARSYRDRNVWGNARSGPAGGKRRCRRNQSGQSGREGDGAVTLKNRVYDKMRLAQAPYSLKIKNKKSSGRMGASRCHVRCEGDQRLRWF